MELFEFGPEDFRRLRLLELPALSVLFLFHHLIGSRQMSHVKRTRSLLPPLGNERAAMIRWVERLRFGEALPI